MRNTGTGTGTISNQWADPRGVPADSRPVRYRVRDAHSGRVVERLSEVAWDPYTNTVHHALHPADQHLGNAVADLLQAACGYFYLEDGEYRPIGGVPSVVVSDDEVRARILRLEQGENRREAEGYSMRSNQPVDYYHLTELPFDQQRALVERIEELKVAWDFAWLGVADDQPPGLRGGPLLPYRREVWESYTQNPELEIELDGVRFVTSELRREAPAEDEWEGYAPV